MEWQYASLREALGKTLLELGGEVPNMLVINADLRNSVKTIYFMNEYPERTIEVGIAEQNMIGVAAGLSMMGFIPFCVTFARFASKRAADQISMSRRLLPEQCAHHRRLCWHLHRHAGRQPADD